MKLSPNLKVLIWILVVGALITILGFRFNAIISGSANTFDTIVTLLLFAIITVPLFGKLDFLGIRIENVIEKINKNVETKINDAVREITNVVMNQDIKQIVNIPPSYRTEKEILQAISTEETSPDRLLTKTTFSDSSEAGGTKSIIFYPEDEDQSFLKIQFRKSRYFGKEVIDDKQKWLLVDSGIPFRVGTTIFVIATDYDAVTFMRVLRKSRATCRLTGLGERPDSIQVTLLPENQWIIKSIILSRNGSLLLTDNFLNETTAKELYNYLLDVGFTTEEEIIKDEELDAGIKDLDPD